MKRALIFALVTATLCAATDLPTAKPESVGFSSDRLQNLHSLIQNEIDQKQLAGAVTILARHGKIIDYRTYGQRDIEKSVPMTKDDIFRAYSMTKPMTGVAMIILHEQGKWLPWHPIRLELRYEIARSRALRRLKVWATEATLSGPDE